MEIFIKKFKEWSFFKERLHYSKKSNPMITEGEIWWCSLGVNVGSEIDGKNYKHTRPVLIFKKLSHDTFLGIPSTTKEKSGNWFVTIVFKGIRTTFILAEVRSLSSKRLDVLIGTMSIENFNKIKTGFYNLLNYSKNMNPSIVSGGDAGNPEHLPLVESTIGSTGSIANEDVVSTGFGDN